MAKHVGFTAADIETEEWRPVVGWEEFGHQVSSIGRVRRLWTFWKNGEERESIFKIPIKKNGYTAITLQHGRERMEYCLIHRLVAKAFLGNPPTSEHQVNHKDGDKTNNKVGNIEWATSHENLVHGREMGLIPRICGIAEMSRKLTEDDVREIRAKGYTAKETATIYGVRREYAWRIVNGKSWKHVKPHSDPSLTAFAKQ